MEKMNHSSSVPSDTSFHGENGYRSSVSNDFPQPPARVLMNGYRDVLVPNEDKPRYNPLNTTHPRSSVLLNASDPVTMYLLTETALGDSKNYEVLSFEEVEELKKEYTFHSGTMEATRRKLAVEMKFRDAAQSLSRLQKPTRHSRNSDEYESLGSLRSSTGSVRKSIFGKKGDTKTKDRTSEEVSLSTHKCEELVQELWSLERRTQETHRRLLEHNAGVLQMTHKGLKKNLKNGDSKPTMQGGYSNDDIPEFDDRSLYKASEHFDPFGDNGNGANGSESVPFGVDAIQSMETKLEELSGRMRAMILQANPYDNADPVPQPASEGGPVNPTATAAAYLAYIENSLDTLDSSRNETSRSFEPDYDTEEQLQKINTRIHTALGRSGPSRAPMLPPPPSSSGGDIQSQISYLNAGMDSIDGRIELLAEQKGILTTQIQQQRELNTKSDAQRDAHIADLVEQLAKVRKELDVSERDNENARDHLVLVQEQLEDAHQNRKSKDQDDLDATMNPEMAALDRAETEISRLEETMEQLRKETDSQKESHEARVRAEEEVSRLRTAMEQLQREKDELQRNLDAHAEVRSSHTHAEAEVARLEASLEQLLSEKGELQRNLDAHAEVRSAHTHAEAEVARLEASLEQLLSEKDELQSKVDAQPGAGRAQGDTEQNLSQLETELAQARSEAHANAVEASAARSEMQGEVSRLQAVIEHLQSEMDARVDELSRTREHADREIPRLENSLAQILSETDARVKEATEARFRAEEESTRLEAEMTELESEVVRAQTELTMCKAELDAAHGSRSQRAAETNTTINPAIQEEIDYLHTRNLQLTEQLASSKAGPPPGGSGDLQKRVETLEKELRETIDDYEAITKSSIELEKEREKLDGIIDSLRDHCEHLEMQVNEERISNMAAPSPTSSSRDGGSETTSTMVLKNEFKKMMRDTRAENMRILKAEQEERRKLEALIRNMREQHANGR